MNDLFGNFFDFDGDGNTDMFEQAVGLKIIKDIDSDDDFDDFSDDTDFDDELYDDGDYDNLDDFFDNEDAEDYYNEYCE